MPRACGGAIGADVELEVTTLARLMKIQRRGDGLTARITDHDENIELVSETVRASSLFELSLATIPHLAGGTGGQGPVSAVGLLTLTGNAVDTNTVTIDGVIYTIVSGALDATGKVKLGVDIPTTLANLRQAIIAGTGAGVLYATGTTAHTTVTAEVIDITLPIWAESTLVATGGISAYFSNFTTNSGAWHDGDVEANNINQAQTSNQKNGMWCGLSFTSGHHISHCKIYTTQVWHSHTVGDSGSSDHPVGWWFGADGHIPSDQALHMMQEDGFDV